jgi:hypothetical protein
MELYNESTCDKRRCNTRGESSSDFSPPQMKIIFKTPDRKDWSKSYLVDIS